MRFQARAQSARPLKMGTVRTLALRSRPTHPAEPTSLPQVGLYLDLRHSLWRADRMSGLRVVFQRRGLSAAAALPHTDVRRLLVSHGAASAPAMRTRRRAKARRRPSMTVCSRRYKLPLWSGSSVYVGAREQSRVGGE
jgi:hypothetical protein